ncbi:MAG TPA: sigma factor, partial [Streptosporangiaceae bacterium]|nr:sigma factor [Streptosporangiaceae bacterium]
MDRPVDATAHAASTQMARPAIEPNPEPEAPAGLSPLVARAQRGDSDAFRTLYRDTQPRLLRYLRAIVNDDAEDIASETWLQVTRDLKTFHGDD